MEQLQQEYILSIYFTYAVERENLLVKKYHDLITENRKNTAVKEIMEEFEKEAREHLSMLKEKMIKLGIRG